MFYLDLFLYEASCAGSSLPPLQTVFLVFHTGRIQVLFTFLFFEQTLTYYADGASFTVYVLVPFCVSPEVV